MILEFNVGNDILKKNNSTTVLDQSADYYKCKFYPKENIWMGSVLSATFMNDLGYIETVNLGEYSELLTCLVPARIVNGGYFSLYISNDHKKTNTISVALTNHYKKAEEKCNIISELFAHINTKIDDVVYENYQLKFYSNGVLSNVIYLGNVDEELIADLVMNQLDTFKSTLAPIAFTGSYNDLVDVPETFTPSQHSHNSDDIEDFDEVSEGNTDNLLSALIDEIDLI